jgi:5'-deoxynucleotidase
VLMYHRLRLMRTAARVRRVHTMPTIHPQTVGEHTFGVMAILYEICHEGVPPALMVAALQHDAPEAITGDVPSPAKWRHPTLEDALRVAEAKISIEFDLQPHELLSAVEHRLLKFADLMELAIFAIEEVDTGNSAMATVARNALTAIAKRDLRGLNEHTERLYSAIAIGFENKYPKDHGKEITHGWPEY